MSVKKNCTIIFLALIAVAAIPLAMPEFLPFGQGTSGSSIPGNAPFVPDLQGYGSPAPGAQVNLFLMNCLGDQPGYIILGTARQDRSFYGGTLYPTTNTVRAIWITPLGGSPPIGYWSLTGLTLPSSPSLSGTSLYLQAITKDPGNPYGATLSNGLEMRIQ
jgi:hypothetical protein